MSSNATCAPPLPISWEECRSRGWSSYDVLLVTGDAYIDHPSFGVALIGRLLESHGYRVAILSQPRFDSANDFRSFPAPRLFCGITAGNLDSIVANYTGNGKIRETDAYSTNGNPWRGTQKDKKNRRRPDRASIIYTSLAKSAYSNTPIVLGGIEASLRRFVHFDYKQDKIRASFLTDAKADLLVYGMGERAVLEIARRCKKGEDLSGINGTCQTLAEAQVRDLLSTTEPRSTREFLVLPSYEDILANKQSFLEAEIDLDRHLRAFSPRLVLQKQQARWVIQYPQSKPMSSSELDQLYGLPFTRKPHPVSQNIPAYRMIKDSVTIVRGCSGNCSFCAITRHQGPAITSRSIQSIVGECRQLTKDKNFSGTISDLGGPTANLFGTSCKIGGCKKRDCLFPQLCPSLEIDEDKYLELLSQVSSIDKVSHLFISSGMRMELLLNTPRLFKKIVREHTPGTLKIAPEHTDAEILELMHKEPHSLLQDFVARYREISKSRVKDKMKLTPYVITSHPGSKPEHARKLVKDMRKLGLQIRKFQDFTPTPGTLSTAMYVSGLRPDNKKPLHVSKKSSHRRLERKILESHFLSSQKRCNTSVKKRR